MKTTDSTGRIEERFATENGRAQIVPAASEPAVGAGTPPAA